VEQSNSAKDLVATAGPDPETAEVFRGLADLVYASDDFGRVYEAIVRAAPRLVDGCDHASLMLRRDEGFVTAASSDEVAARVDALERELSDGPCVDAILEETAQHDTNLLDGSPWPGLAERVMEETPVRGMAGFRILGGSGKVGALNLFSDTPGGLTDRSVDQAIVLASFVSVALVAAHERHAAQTLRQGLESNREIGKAVGLLMAFHKVDDAKAFAMLRTTSQDLNVKLIEIARQVVSHHNQV
jgi:hypothetical protein